MVAADDLSSTLAKMGIHLSKEEKEKALKHIARDAEGKVSLKSALESVMATRQPAMFQKDRVAVQDLEGILASMGIYLTAEELQEALKYAPVDVNGKVNLGEFMKGVKAVQQHPKTGDRVPVGNLDSLLVNMGIYLTDDEIQEALRYAVVDEDGKINLDDFMKGVKIVQRAKDAEGQAQEDSY
uniref:uncharacterized protein LOC130490878 n=1 Tax=Euleptes europaea TaxID=460621 RepID=UPI00254178AE|nr:uncharacterized protein LOC130490878 [Euleptes europaea]